MALFCSLYKKKIRKAVNKSFCFALDKSNAVLLELALIFV